MGIQVTGSLTDKIAALIAGHEGEKLDVYLDQAGLWTVGKGHLIKSSDTVLRDGQPQKLHPFGPVTRITQAECDAFFARDTASARAAVASQVTRPLNDNMRAALTSLVFNIGAAAFAQSTLLKMLNAGNFQGAADQFLVWNKVTVNGAKVNSPGLTSRRAKERELFLS